MVKYMDDVCPVGDEPDPEPDSPEAIKLDTRIERRIRRLPTSFIGRFFERVL